MRIHYLQHVPFEDPAGIRTWAQDKGHSLDGSHLYRGDTLPDVAAIDALLIMGGPMSVGDDGIYPWLTPEKRFIEKAVASGKTVIGICLGAQLLATVLGGTMYRNDVPEIGWFPVSLTEDGRASRVFSVLPEEFMAFHWHGDTYTLPSGCVRTAGSEKCAQQAFEYEGRVIGLQFHLESTADSIGRLIENCRDELAEKPTIQSPGDITSGFHSIDEINRNMTLLLNAVFKES